MVPISALWMPILLSAMIVFVASSILHMVLPFHKSDYRKLPDEGKVTDATGGGTSIGRSAAKTASSAVSINVEPNCPIASNGSL